MADEFLERHDLRRDERSWPPAPPTTTFVPAFNLPELPISIAGTPSGASA